MTDKLQNPKDFGLHKIKDFEKYDYCPDCKTETIHSYSEDRTKKKCNECYLEHILQWFEDDYGFDYPEWVEQDRGL